MRCASNTHVYKPKGPSQKNLKKSFKEKSKKIKIDRPIVLFKS